jgi:hypothetical protein
VRVSAASGGGFIDYGDELKHKATQIRFFCTRAGTYTNGQYVPIQSLDTGPQTNLDAGTVLEWVGPRPGIGSKATITEDSNGDGLTGGRGAGTEGEHQQAILYKKQNPEASGNTAEYLDAVTKTPGFAIQAPFAYPAIKGSGTKCIAFTMFPSTVGGSRIPSAAAVAAVASHLSSEFPEDDGILVALGAEEDSNVALKIKWSKRAKGWEDAVPWPAYYAAASQIEVQSASSALSFILRRASGGYSGVTAPVVGNNIAFFDREAGLFRKKRIGAVSGTGPWTITVDTTLAVSDESYTPEVGQRCCPWSDSLNVVAPLMMAVSDQLGPGEQTATLYDDGGLRRRRVPFPPEKWPSELTDALLEEPLSPKKVPEILDREIAEKTATTPSAGTPGATFYMLRIADLAIFPKS